MNHSVSARSPAGGQFCILFPISHSFHFLLSLYFSAFSKQQKQKLSQRKRYKSEDIYFWVLTKQPLLRGPFIGWFWSFNQKIFINRRRFAQLSWKYRRSHFPLIWNRLEFLTMLKFCELETDVSKDAQIIRLNLRELREEDAVLIHLTQYPHAVVPKNTEAIKKKKKNNLHSYFQPKAAQSLIANVLRCVQERNKYINNKN